MKPMHESVALTARDGVAIAGDYYLPNAESVKGLLLLHMMPADRASWRQFGTRAQEAGWHVLAVDLRGHGASQGGPDGYKNFSDLEHQASRFDVEAGAEFLKSRGVTRLVIGGASIGANLALQYLADPPAGGLDARAAFLLSPGLDYRGIRAELLIRQVRPEQGVYLVSSYDDPARGGAESNAAGVRRMHEISGGEKQMHIFDDAGHGTTIFERKPEFMDEVMAWLNER